MLQQPQNPNNVDSQGTSALMAASEAGDIEVLRLLLEAGAHVNYRDNEGETALALASLRGHVEVVQMLVEACADTNSRRRDGFTPLMRAAAQLLLEAGADERP